MKNKRSAIVFFGFFLTERSFCLTYVHNCPVGFVPMPIFFPDTFILRNEKDMSPNRLRHVVGAAGECISQFIHPSNPAKDTYPNRPKENEVLGMILIGIEMKVIRHGTETVKVFMFRHEDIPTEVLYNAKIYVHVTVEGPP